MTGAGRRVLQVFEPAIGGVPTYVRDLSLGLVQRGWRVHVAASPDAIALPTLAEHGVPIACLPLTRRPRPLQDLRLAARLARLIRRHDIDLVHAHSSKASFVAGAGARLAGRPSVYTPHGFSFAMRVSMPERLLYGAVEATLGRTCHRTLALVSASERELARTWRTAPEPRLRVIHTGLPPAPERSDGTRERQRAALGVSSDDVLFVWIGRHQAAKQPEHLALLAERLQPPARLAALGTGIAGSAEGDAFAERGGILVPDGAALSSVYEAADGLVQTSAWESFPLVVLEAMRAGLPVSAYSVGGVAEQVDDGETGFLVDPDDVDGLAARIRELAAQPALRASMGSAGRARCATDFGYDRMLDEVEALYESLIAQNGPDGAP
jgi:glycosyltransferase involved in cell wall biosynthesis